MDMETQSTLSGFSVQTNRASCVFVRQKVFFHTKTNLPFLTVEDFPPKSENNYINKMIIIIQHISASLNEVTFTAIH